MRQLSDLLFHTKDGQFSCRAAGICLWDGKVLLQKPDDDPCFAFPGGHVVFGETHEQALCREFLEETGIVVSVGSLQWAGELFFRWNGVLCHQLCRYYRVTPRPGFPVAGSFPSREKENIRFYWVPLQEAAGLNLPPVQTAQWLLELDGTVRTFVYREP